MPFFQTPPVTPDPWRGDAALREHLRRVLPAQAAGRAAGPLAAMGQAAAGPLAELAAQAESEPPRHLPFDAWGRRVDRIQVSAAWEALQAEAVRAGLCALPYTGELGEHARVVQHALLHLYGPSSAMCTCPVAMTDAAARVLLDHAGPALRERVVPRLTSRDPATAWTCGQWMTERQGGSDVGRTATQATRQRDAGDAPGAWALHGTKWFTSATTADCALTLARPQGATQPGSGGLALFLVELVDPRDGRRQLGDTIRVIRLKDKLGTRALPTAELELHGATATLIGEPSGGLRRISGMLNLTRFHNAVGAAAGMRRAASLATAYARVREAFGRRLLDLPLHAETLADLTVDAEGAFVVTLRLAQLLGRAEAAVATDGQRRVLRALTPLAKLATGKDAVAVASEALEAFGGVGYVEDTGLPLLLRDAQVLPIWEGTTNVLALDLLRAQASEGGVGALLDDLQERLADAGVPALHGVVGQVQAAREELGRAVAGWPAAPHEVVEAGVRAFGLRLARAYTTALLCEHAAHRLAVHGDDRAALAARRYADRWLVSGPRSTADVGVTARLLGASHPL